MVKYKDKEAKESQYTKYNSDAESVCDGVFSFGNKREICKNRAECPKYKSYKDNPYYFDKKVGFRYVNSFRNCKIYITDKIRSSIAVRLVIYGMLYVNDTACSCVIDMKDKIYDQNKETKKIFNALAKRQVEYEKRINTIMGDYIEAYAEYNLGMDERVKDYLVDLYDSIYSMLNANGIENAQFIAHAELAYYMIVYSVTFIEKRVKECLKYDKEIVNLRSYKLTEMLEISGNLCKWLERGIKKKIDMNDNKKLMDSFMKLDKAMTDLELINDSISLSEKFYNKKN